MSSLDELIGYYYVSGSEVRKVNVGGDGFNEDPLHHEIAPVPQLRPEAIAATAASRSAIRKVLN